MGSDETGESNLYVTDVKGNVLKREKDCSSIAEEAIVAARHLLRDKNLDGALSALLQAERQARMAADVISTSRLMISVIQACFTMLDFDKMNFHVQLLVERRRQLKNAVTEFIRECCSLADKINHIDEQVRFIETIARVTEGRVYVENERARLVRKLSNIKELKGDLKEAAQLIQELQVDTYNEMPELERADFQLEQLRMVFRQKNYSLADTISNKIHPKTFESDFELTKKYHILMARLQNQFKDYVKVALHYKSLLSCEVVQPGTDVWCEAMQAVIVIMIMAERTPEQVEQIRQLGKLKNIDDVSPYNELLPLFLHDELIDVDVFVEKFQGLFHQDLSGIVCTFDQNTEEGRANWSIILDRVLEYNIFNIAKHYSSIKLSTVASHLKIPIQKAEEYISVLVNRGSVYARINHPEGRVDFVENKSSTFRFDEWAESLKELMAEVNLLTDDIKRELALPENLLDSSAEDIVFNSSDEINNAVRAKIDRRRKKVMKTLPDDVLRAHIRSPGAI